MKTAPCYRITSVAPVSDTHMQNAAPIRFFIAASFTFAGASVRPVNNSTSG